MRGELSNMLSFKPHQRISQITSNPLLLGFYADGRFAVSHQKMENDARAKCQQAVRSEPLTNVLFGRSLVLLRRDQRQYTGDR